MIKACGLHLKKGYFMVKRGLFIGRFQPFHNGHLSAVKDILKETEELVIVIGSAQYSHNLSNPFTAGERLTMIRMALQDDGTDCSRIWIVPVPDVHLHMTWVSALEGYTPSFDTVYSNEPLTRRLFIEAGYKVKAIRFYEREHYSATKIREKMLEGANWETLVPPSVSAFIKKIGGVERLQDLAKSDKA
jgi:nicotinamide-nucleotide adenylyltransferase